ncbi:MAG: DUF416 family protein [Luteibacter sp.]
MGAKADFESLVIELSQLDSRKQLAFAIFLIERALPAFYAFQIETGHQGGGCLRAALGQFWSILELGSVSGHRFVTLETCESVIPDSEDYGSPYTSASIDAGAIVCSTFDLIDGHDPEALRAMIQARQDSVDLFLRNREDFPGSGADVFHGDTMQHPLMEEELALMQADVRFLRLADSEKADFFSSVLRRVRELDYGRLRLHA